MKDERIISSVVVAIETTEGGSVCSPECPWIDPWLFDDDAHFCTLWGKSLNEQKERPEICKNRQRYAERHGL